MLQDVIREGSPVSGSSFSEQPASLVESPLFIVGVHRSGTTLLSLMLDSHSRIAIPYESHFIVRFAEAGIGAGHLATLSDRRELVTRILQEPYVQKWDQRIDAGEIDLNECTHLSSTVRQVYRAYARRCGKDIWGDKTPAYIDDLDVLNRLFPDSRFIHIIRDGRDVAASVVKRFWGPNDFVSAIKDWERRVSRARKMLRMLPAERHIELRYEDLVADPVSELKRITAFLQVEFEPGMAEGYRRRSLAKFRGELPGHHVHLVEEPSLSQTFKWLREMLPTDQAIAHEVAGPLLAALRYPPGVATHPLKVPRKALHRLLEIWRGKRGRS